MKNKNFILLTCLHSVFVVFASLLYLSQHYFYSGDATEWVARFYAASLFAPNVIGIAVLYAIYAFWFFKNISNCGKMEGFILHVVYNIFFISGFFLEFFQSKNVTLVDSIFIATELVAIYLAIIIIINNKNKEIWKC